LHAEFYRVFASSFYEIFTRFLQDFHKEFYKICSSVSTLYVKCCDGGPAVHEEAEDAAKHPFPIETAADTDR
jgi:predicted HD phosphohydrolase